MRKNKTAPMCKVIALVMLVPLIFMHLIMPVTVLAVENPEITYSTGTQQNAKDKKDETEAAANEDDGSYDEVILNEDTEEPPEWEDIHISTIDELIEFSHNCKLDTWSRNKRIMLDADISLLGTEFATIPTFGGYFDGQGHVISGFNYSEPVSYFGLFSYIQENAVVKNLKLNAMIRPSGKQIITGGIAGNNSGQILNCTFDGTVEGYNYVGGIAGYNELTGIISECICSGSIIGSHYTGGIAGENVGLISSCVNSSKVNTVVVDNGMSLEEIDISTVTSGLFSLIGGEAGDGRESSSTIIDSGSIDSGGIAGLSIGVIQFCTNNGDVGYEHVGYNTGGIAGRQSGYINACTNLGHIYGRKDIGGIAGQAEPYVVVDFTEDVINKLNDAINRLHDIISVTIDDAGDESDVVSSRLNIIKEYTDKALDNTSYLSDRTVEWTDGVIGQVNQITGRAEYILRESAKSDGPINDMKDAFDDAERAAGELQKTVNDLDIYRYMDEAQRNTYDNAKDRFNFLSKSYAENTAKYTKAGENYYIYKMRDNMDTETSPNPLYPNCTNAGTKLEAYDADGVKIEYTTLDGYGTSLESWLNVASWKHADGRAFCDGTYSDDNTLASDAANELKTSTTEPTKTAVDNKASTAAADAYRDMYGDVITPPTSAGIESELAEQAMTMAGVIAAITPQMDEAAKTDAAKATKSLESAAGNLKDAGSKTNSIITDVVNRGSIVFPELGDEYRQKTNSLVEALQGMSDNMGMLNGEMANGSDTLLADMDDVNDQFNEIMRLYADAIDGVLDNDYSENYDDTSMYVAETCTDATIASCENRGIVEGDIDVSGIAGTMGIEYDFDLESDVTGVKDSRITSTYQSKCVLRGNKNRGIVNAQKSYIGGICGLQEMGTILACENYGRIKGVTGAYIGGIAGDSYSYIQKSYSKCRLYGNKYVAGIAGHGTNILNCYAMVRIMDAKSYYAAIAGDVEEDGKVHYNYFVGDELAGIDRVSYAGKAEPVGYTVLTGMSETPADFSKLNVTFYLDSGEDDEPEQIKNVELKYGDSLSPDEFPEIENKDGYYLSWDITDVSGIRFDEEITATYERYRTTLASEYVRLNTQSAILVDGQFHDGDKLTCTAESLNNVGLENLYEHWTIDFKDDGNAEHLVRYVKPDDMEGDAVIYINRAGKWEKEDITTFGGYQTFNISGTHAEIAICEAGSGSMKYVIIGVCAAAAVVLIIMIIVKINRSRYF